MNPLQSKLALNNIPYKSSDFKTEVHFIGQLIGVSKFNSNDGVFCDVQLHISEEWKQLAPNPDFQTQTAYSNFSDIAIFAHQFDILVGTNSLFNWPRLVCRLWKLDDSGKIDILSYGVTTLPNTSGFHEIEFNTWILQGNLKTEIMEFFLESKPKMNSTDPVSYDLKNRKELFTKPGPVIHYDCNVILKNFYINSISGQS